MPSTRPPPSEPPPRSARPPHRPLVRVARRAPHPDPAVVAGSRSPCRSSPPPAGRPACHCLGHPRCRHPARTRAARHRRLALPSPRQPGLRRPLVRRRVHLSRQQQATGRRHHDRRADHRAARPDQPRLRPRHCPHCRHQRSAGRLRHRGRGPRSGSPGRLPAGVPLHITVRHTSDPSGDQNSGGWVRTSDGLAMANQADAAHRVFPSNDHPADKAYFTFRVTAPKELTVVANGLPAGKVRHGSSTTWTYRTAHPMATELAQVSIGRSTVLERTGPHGLPVRDVVAGRRCQGPRTVAEEDAGAAGVDGAAGRPLPLRDIRTAGRRHEDRLRAGDPDAHALRTVRVHLRHLPRVVRRVAHGARAGTPVVRRQRLPAVVVGSLAQ